MGKVVRSTTRLAAVTILAGAISAGASVAVEHGGTLSILRAATFDPSSRVVGLRVGGVRLDGNETPRDVVLQRTAAIRGMHVRLIPAGAASGLETTFGALGVEVDVAGVVRRAETLGRRGTAAVRFAERLAAARGDIDVPIDVTIDSARTEAVLLPLKDDSDSRPLPARYDFANRRILPGRAGAVLDVDRAIAAIGDAARRAASAPAPDITIELPRAAVAPVASAHAIASLNPRETIAEYSTSFGWLGKDASRAANIQAAASHLDGAVLVPGDVVSFNAVVGPRTVANGFHPAFEIYKGEMMEGVGGGTCQMASTLHAAAVYAGLDIVDRSPHSRPLGYIPLGLDSTVVYPEVDLKLRNPWPFPIAIHTLVSPGIVRVQLLGERKPATVLLSRETLRVEPFTRKIEIHPELAEGRFLRKQKGIRGFEVRVTRRTVTPDGKSHVTVSVDRYPPTPELFWVAPGLDCDQALPPLPDGAVAPAPDGKLASGEH